MVNIILTSKGHCLLHEAVPSDAKQWSRGAAFISAPNNHDRFFFLHTGMSWSPAFDFNVGVAINEWCFYKSTSAILEVDGRVRHCNNINSKHLNDRVTWPPIQPMYWQHLLLFVFYLSHGSDKVWKVKICQHWWKSRKIVSGMQEKTFHDVFTFFKIR